MEIIANELKLRGANGEITLKEAEELLSQAKVSFETAEATAKALRAAKNKAGDVEDDS